MPERQNPTGVTTSEARRAEIAEAVTASGALLVEDGFEEPESGVKPLAARLPDRTIWLGTLSKDLVPGFRIGWIAGPAAIIERLARVKKTADFQTPLPLQAAVAAFLREGGDRRARRARAFDVEAKRITAARVLKALPDVLVGRGDRERAFLAAPAAGDLRPARGPGRGGARSRRRAGSRLRPERGRPRQRAPLRVARGQTQRRAGNPIVRGSGEGRGGQQRGERLTDGVN